MEARVVCAYRNAEVKSNVSSNIFAFIFGYL